MKKSKFFLGGTSIILAVFGAFASKVHAKFATYYYTTVGSSGICRKILNSGPVLCKTGGFGCTILIHALTIGQVYLATINHVCINPLKQTE